MYKKVVSVLILCIISFSINAQSEKKKMTYPQSRKSNETDNYFGTSIADPYRWLEDDKSEEMAKWVESQNQLTQGYLEKIPFREAVNKRITEMANYPIFGIPVRVDDYYIYTKNDGLKNENVYYYTNGIGGDEKVFIDPNKLTGDGTAAVSLLGSSRDKKYMAFSMNQAGSDWQTIRVKFVGTDSLLEDKLDWVKKSGAAWHNNGFYYCRYKKPEKGKDLPEKNEGSGVWYHELGTTQDKDTLVFDDPKNPLRYYTVQTTEDERYLIVSVMQGTYGVELMCQDLSTHFTKLEYLTKGFEHNYTVVDNNDNRLLVLTDDGASNNRLVSIDPLFSAKAYWKEIIPETEHVLEKVGTAGNHLFGLYLENANSQVYQYDYEGKILGRIELPALGTVTGFNGNRDDYDCFYAFTSFTYPTTIYKLSIANRSSEVFRQPKIKFHPDDYITEQAFYSSKDGARIPMFVTYKKGLAMNGNNPTILCGDGGFKVSQTPTFSSSRIAWLEQGGIYVVANLRGGGEYGEAWHKAGMLMKKQNVFNDFIAAAQYLIANNYTAPDKLAITGNTNGGLLVGAVANQYPQLFKVAIPQFGVMDMLRYQKFTIGSRWAVEYGTSEDLASFNNLYKYSPLHNIKSQNYPATLVITTDHDDKVVPAHSFKYIATLQENQTGNDPVLIRIDVKTGSGSGKPLNKQINEVADMFSFAWFNMGIVPKY